ncbi:MAG: antitoxin component YwqK of YwqJK toxin-antitoxin module [Thermoproteota archaeon]|jgi:antitoxin component YwqK of YwqJK toxin-antitoxin module
MIKRRKNHSLIIALLLLAICANSQSDVELHVDSTNLGENVVVNHTWLIVENENNSKFLKSSVQEFSIKSGRLLANYELDSIGGINGKLIRFYANGLPRTIEEYTRGDLCGEYFKFFENGNLWEYGEYIVNDTNSIKCDTTYVEDLETFEMLETISCNFSVKNGVWKIYSKEGEKLKELKFDKGELQKDNKTSY